MYVYVSYFLFFNRYIRFFPFLCGCFNIFFVIFIFLIFSFFVEKSIKFKNEMLLVFLFLLFFLFFDDVHLCLINIQSFMPPMHTCQVGSEFCDNLADSLCLKFHSTLTPPHQCYKRNYRIYVYII